MSKRLPFAERVRRAVRWLWPAAVLAIAPKCLLCVLGYAGLATALGLGGPEICGGSGGASSSCIVWVSAAGVTVYACVILTRRIFSTREI